MTGTKRPKPGYLVSCVLKLVGVTAGLTALLAQFGRVFDAADWANHLLPLWLTCGLAASLGLIVRGGGNGRFGAVLAIWLVMTGGGRWVGALPVRGVAEDDLPQLRIVQFNVLKTNLEPDRAAAWILARHADVVVLEEAAGDGARILALVRTTYPYAVDCLGDRRRCSTVILSRLPFEASGGLARGDPENRKTFSAAWARLGATGSGATVIGVHFGRPWPFGDQDGQVAQLAAFLRGRDTSRTIVVGDFNQTPWTYAMARHERRWGLQRFSGLSATWPVKRLPPPLAGTSLPLLAIDHVYGGRCWRARSIQAGPPLGSDHRPIVADLVAVC